MNLHVKRRLEDNGEIVYELDTDDEVSLEKQQASIYTKEGEEVVGFILVDNIFDALLSVILELGASPSHFYSEVLGPAFRLGLQLGREEQLVTLSSEELEKLIVKALSKKG